MKIGFFSSSLQGIATMKAVVAHLPVYSYEYYGDTVHTPYRDGEEAFTTTYVRHGIEHLIDRECALVVCVGDPLPASVLQYLRAALGSQLPLVDGSTGDDVAEAVELFLHRHPALEWKLERRGRGRNIVLSKHTPEQDQQLTELLEGTFIPE